MKKKTRLFKVVLFPISGWDRTA